VKAVREKKGDEAAIKEGEKACCEMTDVARVIVKLAVL